MANSAANMLPPEYDDVHPNSYDPAYTADISTKMRIPHKIDAAGVTEGETMKAEEERHMNTRRAASMHIPHKIVLDEGNNENDLMENQLNSDMRHFPGFHLDLDPRTMSHKDYISLQTPPRVLTLDENPFPDVQEEKPADSNKNRKSLNVSFQNGYIPATPPRMALRDDLEKEAMLMTPGEGLLIEDDDEDDVAVLRRQISRISRHVIRLEEENARRSQRELFLYPMVMGYLLFQAAKWLLTRN